MSTQVGNTISDMTRREIPSIEVSGWKAEYSTGRTPTGEWFALGTITHSGEKRAMPAWVVVGTGTTVDEAVSNLTLEVRSQAENSSRL
jgi:hypothetical protein